MTTNSTETPTRRERPTKPKMKLRNIRTFDELWTDFGDLCADDGTDTSADLRSHMESRIARARRRGWVPIRER